MTLTLTLTLTFGLENGSANFVLL